MNIADAIKRIAELSDDIIEDIELGCAMYRLGRINELATSALATLEEPDKADAASKQESPDPQQSKVPYVRAENIMDYLWCHEGSVRMEYLLRDLYHGRPGSERNATTTLARMELRGAVHLDREGDTITDITARRMPKD